MIWLYGVDTIRVMGASGAAFIRGENPARLELEPLYLFEKRNE